GYDYYYSKTNTPPGEDAVPAGNTDGLLVNLIGLDMGQTYYCWVRANCGGGDYSGWVNIPVVTTGPWKEEFNGGGKPAGWEVDGYWTYDVDDHLPASDGNVMSKYVYKGETGSFTTNTIEGIETGDVL